MNLGRFTNQKLMNVAAANEKIWNEAVMPAVHLNRITHGRKVSSVGTPVVYPFSAIPGLFILDMYFYNMKSKKGEKIPYRNDNGDIVFPTMYRYLIDYPALIALFSGESVGQNYNFAIKQALRIAPGEKIFDYKETPDKAPTRRDVALIARKSPVMRR